MADAQTVPLKLVKKAISWLEPRKLTRRLGCYINNEKKPDPAVGRLLLDCGATPDGWGPAGGEGHLNVLKVLLEYDKPRWRDWDTGPCQAFYYACSHDRYRTAAYLLKEVEFKLPREDYDCAMGHAEDRKHKRVLTMLRSVKVRARIRDH